jgi:UDP-glucuronate 4-epimerase
LTPYAISKLTNESMGRLVAEGSTIPITVLRIFSTYGPRQRPDLAIHTFFRDMYQGKPINAFAPEGAVRDYIYIKDCVRAIYAAIQTPNRFRTINVASGQGTSLTSLLKTISEISGIRGAINQTPSLGCELRGGVAAISRAQNMLSFSPQYDLKQGITEFYHWFRQQVDESGANIV